MYFSKTWSYAVRALIHLAEHRENGPVLNSVIAQEEGIPGPFLVKILGTLASEGIVDSTRGRNGGFILKRDPKTLNLTEIVYLFERYESVSSCLLGFGKCDSIEPCPLHESWSKAKETIFEFLDKTTIASLSEMIPEDQRKALENLTQEHRGNR